MRRIGIMTYQETEEKEFEKEMQVKNLKFTSKSRRCGQNKSIRFSPVLCLYDM